MTLRYGPAQGVKAMHTEAVARLEARDTRFFLMTGGLYLHQSGQHVQRGTQYAWQGSIEQARAMRRRSDAAAGCKAVPVKSIEPKPIPQPETIQ